MTRRALVHRISASAPDDVSGIEAAIASQRIDPKGVVAVLAKTEGNGLVNDFSRGHATLALRLLFERHLPSAEAAPLCPGKMPAVDCRARRRGGSPRRRRGHAGYSKVDGAVARRERARGRGCARRNRSGNTL